MIRIEHLSVYYDSFPALQDISLSLKKGTIYGLSGANGSGKTTLLRACAGLIEAYEGRILFKGKDIRRHLRWYKPQFTFTPEDVELPPYLSGREFMEWMAAVRKVTITARSLSERMEALGLGSKQNELIVSYSHGMRQKLAIAAVLQSPASFFIFDETFNGLDLQTLRIFKSELRQKAEAGATVLLSSHFPSLITDWCDAELKLDHGRLMTELRQDS